MIPTPEQALAALQNHHRPPRTHHAKVRDALVHVQQSINDESPDVTSIEAFLCPIKVNDDGQANITLSR